MDKIDIVNVYSSSDGVSVDQMNIPRIFYSPIRTDLLQFVHQSMAKNKRQPYSVSSNAGMKTSAKSWGTGRAVARVPRVPGSGTHRSGQGAIANFCRGGRIFGPTRVWRKWHHKINKNQRRQAILSAIASTSILSLVLARGHNINRVPELPLVIESAAESITKTRDAIKSLTNLGIIYDVIIKKKNKKIRAGKGKMRNRKFKNYKGPLFIYETSGRPFRNIPTFSICCFNSLNLLKLAPGGHVGRFCIWSYNSFLKLENLSKIYQNNTNKNEKTPFEFSFRINQTNKTIRKVQSIL
jgi:large subunit ribosomal protein L4e